MQYTLQHAEAEVVVSDVGDNKRRISVRLNDASVYMPIGTYETAYPIALIEKVLNIKGPAYLVDEIMRDESPERVTRAIQYDVFGYVNPTRFASKRVLDFGCGSGGSSMVLSRMLPRSSIVGVELEANLLDLARERAIHYGVTERVKFLLSPDGNSLPSGIGNFDFIFLNAVYEHLLPQERKTVLPLLWQHLTPRGVLFLHQTPYRWFPIETHTTSGLPLINYMPDFVASFYARHFSRRDLKDDNWITLLRKGIRGGSVREILRILRDLPGAPVLLTPCELGLKDRIDMWYAVSPRPNDSLPKTIAYRVFKSIKLLTGQTVLPTLSLAIQKNPT
jgi:2-polyprenyl-3-methyl-5-hydroxy-6-metoxy-1,4-benzoquinol methylase